MDTHASAFLDTPTRIAEQVCMSNCISVNWLENGIQTYKQYNNVLLYEKQQLVKVVLVDEYVSFAYRLCCVFVSILL